MDSTSAIEVDKFVPKADNENRYSPVYLIPYGKVSRAAFTVIRKTIRAMDKVAVGSLALTNRENIVALGPQGNDLADRNGSVVSAKCYYRQVAGRSAENQKSRPKGRLAHPQMPRNH